VGPVLDVQLQNQALSSHSTILDQLQGALANKEQNRYLFVPCVYDSILIIRPCINFRDGTSAANTLFPHSTYLSQIPFNESLVFSLANVIPASYDSSLSSDYLGLAFQELCSMATEDSLIGFTSVFMISKSYLNFLVCEISQLCYGGILRSVALGTTDGLSTWKVSFLNLYQPVTVPVGKLSLGRIFNVTGSAIDRYLDLGISCCFSSLPPLACSLSGSSQSQNNSNSDSQSLYVGSNYQNFRLSHPAEHAKPFAQGNRAISLSFSEASATALTFERHEITAYETLSALHFASFNWTCVATKSIVNPLTHDSLAELEIGALFYLCVCSIRAQGLCSRLPVNYKPYRQPSQLFIPTLNESASRPENTSSISEAIYSNVLGLVLIGLVLRPSRL